MTSTTTIPLDLDEAAAYMATRFGNDWNAGFGATEHGFVATVAAGSEAPDSPMVGGVGHGIDDNAAAALRQAFVEFGYKPSPPPNELDLLAAATENVRAADKNLDLASKRLTRARWLHWSSAVQLAVAIALYLLGAFDVYARLC